MKYIYFFILSLLVPALVSAQSVSISGAVKTESSNSGNVRFTYEIEEGMGVSLSPTCSTNAKFFVEETGAVVSCGETYVVPNPGEGGRLEVIPYEVPQDTVVTHILYQVMQDGTKNEFTRQTISLSSRVAQPVFKNVSVRQEDVTKPKVTLSWETLEKSDVALVIGCDSKELTFLKGGEKYSCNQQIALDTNSDKGSTTLEAQNYSLEEGLLFTFTAEKDGVIGALKNVSFTFETTTDNAEETEVTTDEEGLIKILWAQVQALLQVLAGLFS